MTRKLWHRHVRQSSITKNAASDEPQKYRQTFQPRHARHHPVENCHSEWPNSASNISLEAQPGQQNSERAETMTLTDPVGQRQQVSLKYKVLFGLALPFALSSLDVTIIASALPSIASVFSECSMFLRVTQGFRLTKWQIKLNN
jgi:hypothetical protein